MGEEIATFEINTAILKDATKKAYSLEVGMVEEITDRTSRTTVYLPKSLAEKNGEQEMSFPDWLIKSKAREVAYNFLSNYGRKGTDHLAGATVTVFFGNKEEIVFASEVRNYARKRA
jgi:hypothetical protein